VVGLFALIDPGQPSRPEHVADWLEAAIPYIGVAALGLTVGLAELTSAFSDYPMRALSSPWGWGLIVVNGVAAVLALGIVRSYMPDGNLFLTILATGIGFPAIVRTNIVLAKQFAGTEAKDLSLNLGWLYEQFQNLCKNQIDLGLMRQRRRGVDALLERFPDERSLYNIAYYTIISRGTLSPDEETRRLTELNEVMTNQALPPEVIRPTIALSILENGGEGYTDLLIHTTPTAPAPVQALAKAPERQVQIQELIDGYSLEQLGQICHQAIDEVIPADAEERERLQSYVDDWLKADEISEHQRKMTLARFLIEKAGAKFVASLTESD
jgi:hypothetical protein